MKKRLLPYRVYTIPVLLLATAGFLASLYLSLSHYRNYTDIDYSSFCAISQSINCDTVSQSSWSVLLGIPLALWGVFVYSLFFILALPAQFNCDDRRGLWDILFVIAFVCSIADVVFGYISAIKIHAYCIMCLFTYAVSFSLLFLIWIIRRRFNSYSLAVGIRQGFSFLRKDKCTIFALSVLFFVFISLELFLPTYWVYEYPQLSEQVHTGVTEDGHPWIGAEQPELTINEFTDYQCFQCSKIHLTLRYLVNEYPDKIRLVHYHYPMDENFNTVLVKKPFHTGSGGLAMLAIASVKQDRFWQVNDALYSVIRQGIREFNINKFANKLDLNIEQLKQDMNSQFTLKQLESDIRKGLKNKIIGTPSFIIDEKVYVGHIPPEILEKIKRQHY